MNGLFTLKWIDVLDSAVSAVFVAVVLAFAAMVTAPNFDVFSLDWASVLHVMVNVSVVTFIGSLAKNFMSTSDGKTFGKI